MTVLRALASTWLCSMAMGCSAAPPPSAGSPAPARAAALCPDVPDEPELDAELVDLVNEADRMARVDPDGAIRKYLEALAEAPRDHRILRKLALAYEKKEAFAELAKVLETSTAAYPTFADDWARLGRARAALGDTPGAKAAFESCAQADARRAECHLGLAGALLELREDPSAIAELERAIRGEPRDVRAFVALADLYARLERPNEAVSVVRAARQLGALAEKDDLALHGIAARVAAERGDFPIAIEELEGARALADPSSKEAVTLLYSLGVSYASATPPRRAEATTSLRGFILRACKGSKASQFAIECATAQELVSRLGGSL